MLVGVMGRLGSEAANIGLYARGRDRAYALVNIGGAALSLALVVTGTAAAGLMGAGAAMAGSGAMLFGVRLWLIGRIDRQDGQAA
jgi:O-antigen/teichoic acid export membrane protein